MPDVIPADAPNRCCPLLREPCTQAACAWWINPDVSAVVGTETLPVRLTPQCAIVLLGVEAIHRLQLEGRTADAVRSHLRS